jgi:DNA-sulfur modification-associated
MSLSQLSAGPSFRDYVQGTYGEFATPAGRVSYLMTKARLGSESTAPERRLTQHLAPVREVIQAEELDFSQLLQRDLDDHRVATSLVPYLLSPDWTGPAFFPPIVAIALPFQHQHPSEFPALGAPQTVTDMDLPWAQQDAGHYLRSRRLLGANGQINPVPLGQLWWNPEFCRIVVVDGQHRAMALLAIDRTMRGTWQGSGGERYKYFYETRIKELLKLSSVDLDTIEIPVTLLWFPDKFGAGNEPHKAARKLFVDVNKEARAPSESRLILLSDSELVNILTRATLTQMRNQEEQAMMPLYCVEYDNPDTKTTQSARWSALTNIHIIKQMVNRVIFGPPKYVTDLKMQIGAREPEAERDAFMRTQLRLDSIFPPVLDGEEPFARDKIGNHSFPESAISKITDTYRDTWSTALLTLLSDTLPFKAHASALAKLKQNWLPDEAIATLAHDALFSGVGMYWTLRESAIYYQEERLLNSTLERPDVVKAWDLIASKQAEFEDLRARELLGITGRKEISNQLYQAVNTHACQLGLALTLATVFELAPKNDVGIVELAHGMSAAINSWMNSKTTGIYDRRVALAKRRDDFPKNSLNVITNMDAPRAVQFRYFWLEILCSPEALPQVETVADAGILADLRNEARSAYADYIAGEKAKALRTTNPEKSDQQRRLLAKKEADKELRTALIRWFEIPARDIDAWLDARSPSGASGAGVTETEDEDEESSSAPETVSIEDLLGPGANP